MRKVYAELGVNEGGVEESGTLDFVESWIARLSPNKIVLRDAIVSDEDDTDDWWRYIDYVIAWGFAHHADEDCSAEIMTYSAWKNQETQDK